MLVPSKDVWLVRDFLSARAKQTAAAKVAPPTPFEETILAKGGSIVVTDMGDEVVCDDCNADCLAGDPMPVFIHLVAYARRAVCDECYDRKYKDEPLRHRQLMSDGTLGPVLPHPRGADEEA